MSSRNPNTRLSYLALRRLIGVLGMLLPLAVFCGGWFFASRPLGPSISSYWHTNSRDILVGLLVAVGLFLITYKGYEWIDDAVSTVTGIAAFGVAFFPCLSPWNPGPRVGLFQLLPDPSNSVHLACAGIFFGLLAFNSLFLFTRTGHKGRMTPNKRRRNAVYIVCGVLIAGAMAADGVTMGVMGEKAFDQTTIAFWLEVVMLVAFGVSWLVKGEAILGDKSAGSGAVERSRLPARLRVNFAPKDRERRARN